MNFNSEETGCLALQVFRWCFLLLNTKTQTFKPESENLNQKGRERYFVWKESRQLCSFIYMHLIKQQNPLLKSIFSYWSTFIRIHSEVLSGVTWYEIWPKQDRRCFAIPLQLCTSIQPPANKSRIIYKASNQKSFLPLQSSFHPVCLTKPKYRFKITLHRCHDNAGLRSTEPMQIYKYLQRVDV